MRMGFMGAGNMAGAILDAVLSGGVFEADSLWAYDPDGEKLAAFSRRGVHLAKSGGDLADRCELILLAVKPQVMPAVLEELRPHAHGKLFVSIAAGISASFLKGGLGDQARVVRVMPNTPLMVGCGATAVAEAPQVPGELFKKVVDIFSAAGAVRVIPESLMNEVIAVNGSSPAFFFYMAELMERAAVEQGIPPETAHTLLAKTMEGSARMLLESGRPPEELRRQVSSPGGTTLAALTAFDDFDFQGLLREAMVRCLRRAEELGR